MEFQTRSEAGELQFYPTFQAAWDAAKKDKTIWKISFSVQTGECIRLVRDGVTFKVELLMEVAYK